MKRAVVFLFAMLSLFLSSGARAAAGSVGATDVSPAIATGALGTTTVQWSSSGVATAEVWVSMDDAAESLFARAPSGSQSATWIQAGHDYQFKLYAERDHAVLLGSVRVWGESAYKVGVDYHATGADFLKTSFVTQYHAPGVRDVVRTQLQSLADRGATVIHTRLWMVVGPGGSDFGETWRAHFPLSTQEAANLRNYAQDVAAVRAVDGHRLRLDITLLWLGAADFQQGSPAAGLGYERLSESEFASRVRQTVASTLGAVADVVRSDGRKVVDTLYLDGEVMVGAKANQDWFLATLYPGFVASVRSAGLTPSLYFLAAATESEVLDNGFVDGTYPVLSRHRSMYWIYRSLRFLKDHALPIPSRIDFSCYPERRSATYFTLVQRVLDDADATLPSLGIASKYGVVETMYLLDSAERRALGQAFATQRLIRSRLERVLFWTTPDGGGSGVHVGFPLAVEDYLP